MEAVADKSRDPLVFTYLGYSHRKLGQTQLGFAYYHRALAIDPNSLNTHEYLGEGYAAITGNELIVGPDGHSPNP